MNKKFVQYLGGAVFLILLLLFVKPSGATTAAVKAGMTLARTVKETLHNLALPGALNAKSENKVKKNTEEDLQLPAGAYGFTVPMAPNRQNAEAGEELAQIASRIVGIDEEYSGMGLNLAPAPANQANTPVPYIVPMTTPTTPPLTTPTTPPPPGQPTQPPPTYIVPLSPSGSTGSTGSSSYPLSPSGSTGSTGSYGYPTFPNVEGAPSPAVVSTSSTTPVPAPILLLGSGLLGLIGIKQKRKSI